MNKICITTGFNKGYKPIGELCLKSIKKYAKKFGHDVEIGNEYFQIEEPHIAKLIMILDLFERGYEYVMWVDADAIFIDYEQDILKEIDEGKDLYLVKHNYKGTEIANTGVMLIKNSMWSFHLLRDIVIKYREGKMKKHAWFENGLLNEAIGYYWMPKNFILKLLFLKLGLKFQRENKYKEEYFSNIKWLDNKWNYLVYENMGDCEDVVIVHYANQDNRDILKEMKKCSS